MAESELDLLVLQYLQKRRSVDGQSEAGSSLQEGC